MLKFENEFQYEGEDYTDNKRYETGTLYALDKEDWGTPISNKQCSYCRGMGYIVKNEVKKLCQACRGLKTEGGEGKRGCPVPQEVFNIPEGREGLL